MNENITPIESFKINHRLLTPGFYISRKDGSIITYDMRTRIPNSGNYMDNATMHSVEHMFATLIRNSEIADRVIYFGPMGCQTGFYLIVDKSEPTEVFSQVKKVIKKILEYEGDVFGASAEECGNYKNLSLDCAKKEMSEYLKAIENTEGNKFEYKQ